jgi:hypothetical protein
MAGPLSNKVVTAKIAAHSRTGAQLDHSVQRQPPRRTNKHTSSTSCAQGPSILRKCPLSNSDAHKHQCRRDEWRIARGRQPHLWPATAVHTGSNNSVALHPLVTISTAWRA